MPGKIYVVVSTLVAENGLASVIRTLANVAEDLLNQPDIASDLRDAAKTTTWRAKALDNRD